MTSARDEILGRIREALREKAHEPVATGADVPPKEWLPPVGDTLEERIALFAANAAQLRAGFHVCDNAAAAAVRLRELAGAQGWKRIGIHNHPLTQAVYAGMNLPLLVTDEAYSKSDLEGCDVGVTACECLVAQTGSVLISTDSSGGRALSVLPPHHVVVATADQLVADLSEALHAAAARHGADWPSLLSFITGPSRTGDIERILVLGAHGPKELTILLIRQV